MANSSSITGCQAWSHRNRVPRSKELLQSAGSSARLPAPSPDRIRISPPPLAENFHQQRSRHESANVRPERNSAHVLPLHRQRRRRPAQKLQREPVSQDDPCRHPHHEHKKPGQHPRPRIQNEISSQHPGDGPAGSQCRHARVQIDRTCVVIAINPVRR